jgi:hypothetical protein
MNFRTLASITALGCFSLAAVWTFAPELLLKLWGVDLNSAAAIMARRNGAAFLGFGVMFFCARTAQPSSARSAMSTGFGIGCLALAALGFFELVTGHVGLGILTATLVEIPLGFSFLVVARTQR